MTIRDQVLAKVLQTVSRRYALSASVIVSASKQRKVVEARDVYIAILREIYGYTDADIAKLLDYAAPSTAVRSRTRIEGKRLADPDLDRFIRDTSARVIEEFRLDRHIG